MNAFGDPYDEEIFYSAVARHKRRISYQSYRALVEDLFGTKNLVSSIDFPSHLQEFISHLSPVHSLTVDHIIDHHSLFPYYTAFVDDRLKLEIRELMHGPCGRLIFTKLGILGKSTFRNKTLRYCPECVCQDRQSYGEAFFHRVHQIGGVMACPHHDMLLSDTDIGIYRFRKQIHEFRALEECEPETTGLSVWEQDHSQQVMAISRDAYWLLTQPHRSHPPEHFTRHYQKVLLEKNLVSSSLTQKCEKIYEAFIATMPEDLLQPMGIPSTPNSHSWWLFKLFRKNGPKQSFPLYHLLTAQFLSIDLARLFNESPSIDVVGENLSSNPKTLELPPTPSKHYIYNPDANHGVRRRKAEPTDKERTHYREKYRCLQKQFPELSATALKKQDRKTYEWLNKHDREFLRDFNNRLPAPKRAGREFDWKGKDEECCDEILRIVEKMKQIPGKRNRITRVGVGNRLQSVSVFHKKQDQLPKSVALLNSLVESPTEFAIRKIQWRKEELKKSNKLCTRWYLAQRACVTHLLDDDEMRDVLDTAYAELVAHFSMPQPVSD